MKTTLYNGGIENFVRIITLTKSLVKCWELNFYLQRSPCKMADVVRGLVNNL